MRIQYVATEFAGDPPQPIARWYKVQAGIHARYSQEHIDFYNPADLKVEQSLGTVIDYVKGDGRQAEADDIVQAWTDRGARRA